MYLLHTNNAIILIMTKNLVLLSLLIAFVSCKHNPEDSISHYTKDYEAISLLGDTLRSAAPSEKLLAQYLEKKEAFAQEPHNIDNIIWYGRFTAYTGKYNEAIAIYTRGLELFPEDARLYRHRGHRYISIREFDKAILDFNKAIDLIRGTENQIEPDGMPNARNIPVSTLHGNIFYHLGLAHYLKQEWKMALHGFRACIQTSSNPDNMVSATHWTYMIFRRMGNQKGANNYLRNISADMDIIENTSYHTACLFYKGEIAHEEINLDAELGAANTALKYALGNWELYSGNQENAITIYEDILSGDDWASFGYIAAESDMSLL